MACPVDEKFARIWQIMVVGISSAYDLVLLRFAIITWVNNCTVTGIKKAQVANCYRINKTKYS